MHRNRTFSRLHVAQRNFPLHRFQERVLKLWQDKSTLSHLVNHVMLSEPPRNEFVISNDVNVTFFLIYQHRYPADVANSEIPVFQSSSTAVCIADSVALKAYNTGENTARLESVHSTCARCSVTPAHCRSHRLSARVMRTNDSISRTSASSSNALRTSRPHRRQSRRVTWSTAIDEARISIYL